MNKDQVVGRLDQAVGKLKEVVGKAVGNESLQADGLAEQAGGKVTSSISDTKESLKNKAKDVIDKL
jgi:uncharacterized protein YjbJ (UPF0337 family)